MMLERIMYDISDGKFKLWSLRRPLLQREYLISSHRTYAILVIL